jgi:hypothetical protein
LKKDISQANCRKYHLSDILQNFLCWKLWRPKFCRIFLFRRLRRPESYWIFRPGGFGVWNSTEFFIPEVSASEILLNFSSRRLHGTFPIVAWFLEMNYSKRTTKVMERTSAFVNVTIWNRF